MKKNILRALALTLALVLIAASLAACKKTDAKKALIGNWY